MKKIKWCLMIIICSFFTACSENGNQVYVKNIFLSMKDEEYVMEFVCLDFVSESGDMKLEKYTDNELTEVGIKAMKNQNYNFRLCENVFISPEIFLSDTNKAVYMINGLKISPAANIFCYTENSSADEIVYDSDAENRIYDLSTDNGSVTGIFPVLISNGKTAGAVIVKGGIPVDVLNDNEFKVFRMLINEIKECRMVFRDETMWADINNINTAFHTDGEMLNVAVNFSVKDFKGLNSSMQSRKIYDSLLETHIANTVYDLYRKLSVSEISDIWWYSDQYGIACKDVNVKAVII